MTSPPRPASKISTPLAASASVGRQNVRATAISADAQRQHRWVLDEQQQIVHPPGLALGDERTLQRQRIGVGNQAKTADIERTHELIDLIGLTGTAARPIGGSATRQERAAVCGRAPAVHTPASSQCSIWCLMCDMNSSATAPSMMRWS